MTEALVTAAVARALDQHGVWYYKVHGAAMSRAGVPDFVVCYRGRFLGLEVKARDGIVSRRQYVELAAIEDAGGVARVVRSADDAEAALRDV